MRVPQIYSREIKMRRLLDTAFAAVESGHPKVLVLGKQDYVFVCAETLQHYPDVRLWGVPLELRH